MFIKTMCGRWITKLRFHDFDLGNEANYDEFIDLNNDLFEKNNNSTKFVISIIY